MVLDLSKSINNPQFYPPTNSPIHKGIVTHLLPNRRDRSVSTQHRRRVGKDEEPLLNGLQNRLVTTSHSNASLPLSALQIRATNRVLEQRVSAEEEAAERVADAARRMSRSEDHVALREHRSVNTY